MNSLSKPTNSAIEPEEVVGKWIWKGLGPEGRALTWPPENGRDEARPSGKPVSSRVAPAPKYPQPKAGSWANKPFVLARRRHEIRMAGIQLIDHESFKLLPQPGNGLRPVPAMLAMKDMVFKRVCFSKRFENLATHGNLAADIGQLAGTV